MLDLVATVTVTVTATVTVDGSRSTGHPTREDYCVLRGPCSVDP